MTEQTIVELANQMKSASDSERRDLIESFRHKEHCLRVLNQFAVSLIDIKSREDLAWYVAKEVVAQLGFVDCVVYEMDKTRNILVQRAAMGEKSPDGRVIVNPMEVTAGRGITGRVAQTRLPVMIGDLEQEPDYVRDLMQARSEICVPLVHGDDLLGLIDCEDVRPNHFTHDHMEILTTVAAMASAKLAQCRMIEELELQAQILKRVREAILVVDPNGIVTRINEGAMAVLGYEPDELLGRSLACLSPDEASWRRNREEVLEIVDKRGVWRGLGEVVRGTGDHMQLEMSITALMDDYGNRVATIIVGRDANAS